MYIDNGLVFTEGYRELMTSEIQRCSLHCKSCKESHPHPYVPHKEQTSEQLQQQGIYLFIY